MNCLYCGKEITFTFRKGVKYCSKSCGVKYHNEKNRVKRFCVYCGKELPVKKRSYCSAECRENYEYDTKHDKYKKPETEKTKNPSLSISEINERARAEGLNYGQYVAKYGLY